MSNYRPNEMLDSVKKELCLSADRDLAKTLGVERRFIGRLRSQHMPLTADWLLRIHAATGWGVDYIRGLAGDESEGFFCKPRGGRGNYFWSEE